jgi:hypothetical protein
VAILNSVPTLTLGDGLRAVRLKLWDEDQRRLVTFRQALAQPSGTLTRSDAAWSGFTPAGSPDASSSRQGSRD